MRRSNPLLPLALFLALGSLSVLWAAPEEKAYLNTVIGLVHAVNAEGKARRVFDGQWVHALETLQVGEKSEAVLVCPDGTLLSLASGTQMKIASLKRPSPQEKNFLFNLDAGRIFAQVKKLFSAKSSFEINAGGLICGVRGTQYTVDYDPKTKAMNLDVFDGAVNAFNQSVTQLFTAGQAGHFVNGQWDGKVGQAPPAPKGFAKAAGIAGGNGGAGSGGGSTGNGTGGAGTGQNGGGPLGSAGPGSGNNAANFSVVPGSGQGYQPNSSLGSLSNLSLGDLNTQYNQLVVINQDNNLSSTQLPVHIQVVVPAGEAVP